MMWRFGKNSTKKESVITTVSMERPDWAKLLRDPARMLDVVIQICEIAETADTIHMNPALFLSDPGYIFMEGGRVRVNCPTTDVCESAEYLLRERMEEMVAEMDPLYAGEIWYEALVSYLNETAVTSYREVKTEMIGILELRKGSVGVAA